MVKRLKRFVAILGVASLIGSSAAAGHMMVVQPTPKAAAHNYTVANWSTCQYDVYREAPRPTGSHLHQYWYSYNMPSNYCSG